MNWDETIIIVSGISTLAIFSFLWKENRFFRLFEHLFIGIAAGYLPVVTIKTFLWPMIFEPMFGLNLTILPDGTVTEPYNPYYLLYLIPFGFGLLYYCIFSKRLSWVAKIVIAFSLGASAGLSVQGFFAEVIPQLTSSFKPLDSIDNVIFICILLSVMYYFFFSTRLNFPASDKVRVFGRYAMMVCFGAFFGSTVMARLALLVERLQFLINDWVPVVLRLL